MNMFETASRLKLRFNYRGLITVEDLWDLSLRSLDDIYKGLNKQVKAQEEDSLLVERKQADKEVVLALEIVKHVVAVKLQEQAEQKARVEKKAQKAKLMEILAQKQDGALHELSVEELQAKLAELD